MNIEDAIYILDSFEPGDSERAHSDADLILLKFLDGRPELKPLSDAWVRARTRIGFYY